jgi:GT2 family glycosyltransferase
MCAEEICVDYAWNQKGGSVDNIVLSIIIPVFNKFPLTRDCLVSLQKHSPQIEYEVIVVDNGSSDETVTELEQFGVSLFGERFQAIRLDENINFGPGCNQGARQAKGSYLFFLNNDTVLTPDWCQPLMASIKEDVGMAGPLLAYPDSASSYGERVQHLGVACMPQLHPTHLYEYFPIEHPVVRKKRALQFLTGAAILLPKNIFCEAGMFCEEYVNGGEDLDRSVQVRKCGYSIVIVPESKIYHLLSQTPGRHDHEEDQCIAMMAKEPLFSPAYEHLIRLKEEAGDYESVVSIRFLQTKLFPSKMNGERLHHAATRAGNETMVREGREIQDFYVNLEHVELDEMAREMVGYSRRLSQAPMEQVYTSWLASCGIMAG